MALRNEHTMEDCLRRIKGSTIFLDNPSLLRTKCLFCFFKIQTTGNALWLDTATINKDGKHGNVETPAGEMNK